VVKTILDAVKILQSVRASESRIWRNNNSVRYLHYTWGRKIEDCLKAEEKGKIMAKELLAQHTYPKNQENKKSPHLE